MMATRAAHTPQMHFCILCFNLVDASGTRACGHIFHKHCIAAWTDAATEPSLPHGTPMAPCPVCPIERELSDADMAVGWEFVRFIDARRPEILQSFFQEDDAAAAVLFDLITGSPFISAGEMFSLREFSHPVFLAFVAHVARRDAPGRPRLLDEFIASASQAATRRETQLEVLGFAALARMAGRARNA